jgi:hypothetical protein
MLSVIRLNIVMLYDEMLSAIFVEWCYAKCHDAECGDTKIISIYSIYIKPTQYQEGKLRAFLETLD